MRVIIDKLEAPPPHALSREDIKALLLLVQDWHLTLFNAVHLRAMLPGKAHKITSYRFVGGGYCLSLYCRGLTPQQAREEFLWELLMQSMGVGYNKPSGNQERNVNEALKVAVKKAEAEAKERETISEATVGAP